MARLRYAAPVAALAITVALSIIAWNRPYREVLTHSALEARFPAAADETTYKLTCDSSGRLTRFAGPVNRVFEDPSMLNEPGCPRCPRDFRRLVETAMLAPWPKRSDSRFREKALSMLRGERDSMVRITRDGVGKVQLYYPYSSPYTYVMGNEPRTDRPRIPLQVDASLKLAIEASTATNVDPFLYLGLAMMENPGSITRLNQHIHDTNAAIILGCNANATHQLQEKAWPASVDLKKLIAVFNNNRPSGAEILSASPGTSYACVGEVGGKDRVSDYLHSLRVYHKKPDDRFCCSKLPFKFRETPGLLPSRFHEDRVTTLLSTGVLMKFMQLFQDRAGPDLPCAHAFQNLPEFRIQRFLGFSTSTGSGMTNTVGAFRLGTNSCVSPNYGYQAMDYILNSLAPNPTVNRLWLDAASKYGGTSKSILCQGRPAGVFSVPANYYFSRHAATRRFTILRDHHKAGGKYFSVKPDRQQRPIIKEFYGSPYVRAKLGENYRWGQFLGRLPRDYYSEISGEFRSDTFFGGDKQAMEEVFDAYFTRADLYQARDTIAKASRLDSGGIFTWEPYTDEEFAKALQEIKIDQNF